MVQCIQVLVHKKWIPNKKWQRFLAKLTGPLPCLLDIHMIFVQRLASAKCLEDTEFFVIRRWGKPRFRNAEGMGRWITGTGLRLMMSKDWLMEKKTKVTEFREIFAIRNFPKKWLCKKRNCRWDYFLVRGPWLFAMIHATFVKRRRIGSFYFDKPRPTQGP